MAVVPSAASLILKALNEPPRDRKKVMHLLIRGADIGFVLVRVSTLKGIHAQTGLSPVVRPAHPRLPPCLFD